MMSKSLTQVFLETKAQELAEFALRAEEEQAAFLRRFRSGLNEEHEAEMVQSEVQSLSSARQARVELRFGEELGAYFTPVRLDKGTWRITVLFERVKEA